VIAIVFNLIKKFRKISKVSHYVYMQFILITKHKHMYINSRIIQNKTKDFSLSFPFFSLFVNTCRYDIIGILIIIAESYKKKIVFLFFFFPFVNRYDMIWNSPPLFTYLSLLPPSLPNSLYSIINIYTEKELIHIDIGEVDLT
jgi:hypothetical protein